MQEIYSYFNISEEVQEKISNYFAGGLFIGIICILLAAFWTPICLLANLCWIEGFKIIQENREIVSRPLAQLALKDIFQIAFSLGVAAFFGLFVMAIVDGFRKDWVEQDGEF